MRERHALSNGARSSSRTCGISFAYRDVVRVCNVDGRLTHDQDNEARFVEAITKDIGKPSVMIQAMEIMLVANEVLYPDLFKSLLLIGESDPN
jgi:hypothetical protein